MRVDETIEIIKDKEALISEFDNKIFNALAEKIEILKPTHFVFVL